MMPEEEILFLGFLRSLGNYRFLCGRYTTPVLIEFDHPDKAEWRHVDLTRRRGPHSSLCYLWDPAVCRKPYLHPSQVQDYYIGGTDAICLSRGFDEQSGIISGRIEIDELVSDENGATDVVSSRCVARFREVSAWIKGRSRYLRRKRMYVTEGAISRYMQLSVRPEWLRDLMELKKRSSSDLLPLGYQESFELLSNVVGMTGRPRITVRRRPRYDDERPGPTLFRSGISTATIRGLKMPGLYIGRCEMEGVCLADSDLRMSTINWNTFTECDFSRCNLSGSDMRGNLLHACRFSGANLRKADLRGSGFTACDFTGAGLTGAVLNESQRTDLQLDARQQEAIAWTEDYEEPDGG